tara:strand:- start:629 stop:1726 length:1098 start_codon:yes stop_codon:yes gene_type:complete
MSLETAELSIVDPNTTINSGSSESCDLITNRRFFGDYYTVSYAVFLLQAQTTCKISIDSWRFPMISHPKMKENMELLKFNSNHGDIKVAILNLLKIPSKIYKSDSNVKALVAVADTNIDRVLRKIRKWNLNVESIRRMSSGRQCLLAASKLDIKAKWPEYFIKSTNMKTNCCGNSVLQFDFCEDTSYTINSFGDHVFSYSFPVEGVKDSRIGFRYTLASSKDSSLENLVNIGYNWQNFRTPTSHNFKGIRIPCFSNILTSSGISQLKNAYAGAWEVFGLQSNGIFNVNKKGHSISLKTLVVAQKKGFNRPPKKNSKYLCFYNENECGYPLKFNIFVECFYQHGDGSCQNKIPLVGTFINENDLLL